MLTHGKRHARSYKAVLEFDESVSKAFKRRCLLMSLVPCLCLLSSEMLAFRVVGASQHRQDYSPSSDGTVVCSDALDAQLTAYTVPGAEAFQCLCCYEDVPGSPLPRAADGSDVHSVKGAVCNVVESSE